MHDFGGTKGRGTFTHAQAEGIAEVLAEPDASLLATKLDLQVLKTDFEKALHRQTWPWPASFSRKPRSSSPCSSCFNSALDECRSQRVSGRACK
jgi:hypothetical protein